MAKKILVIDDDLLVAKSLSKLLGTRGFEVSIAHNGLEAINNITKLDFDLIISDIRMPDMDGIETLKKISEEYAQLNKKVPPKIVITGYSIDEAYRQASELGVEGYLYKPFDSDKFIQTIEKNLEPAPFQKRIYPRIKVKIPIRLGLKSLISDIVAETFDLSEGGVGLILKTPLPLNTLVTFYTDSSFHNLALEAEAQVIWFHPLLKERGHPCGLRFTNVDMGILKEILSEINRQQIKNFFGTAVPNLLMDDSRKNYLFETFDQKQIMGVIDFTPPFLKIEKIAVLGLDRDDILQIRGLASGVLTLEDTKGHYNDTIFLAKCGWLMASAASIYLAILFSSTAPQVIQADGVRPIEKQIWKPADQGTSFWVEVNIIKKKMQLVITSTRILFDEILYGAVDKLKLVLATKESIWEAKQLPAVRK